MESVSGKSELDMMRIKKVPPGILWHYTTIDVLEHFARGEIAFSHCRFMNDDSELAYGRQVLRTLLENVKDDAQLEFLDGKIVDELLADADLFCLSRDGDSLYQWRSYTPQGGIAVGFTRQGLFSSIWNGFSSDGWSSLANTISGFLLKCRYRDDFSRRVLLMLNRKKNLSTEGCCNGNKRLGLYFEMVIKVLLSQKNPTFREEQEERFLVTGVPRDKVTIITGKPRILVRDEGIPKSISFVRLSPHGDKVRDRLLVEIIRDKYGLSFPIELSSSSYNGK